MKIKILGGFYLITAMIFLLGFIYLSFVPLFFDHRRYLIFEFDLNKAIVLLVIALGFFTLSVGVLKMKKWAWKAGLLAAVLLGIFNFGALIYVFLNLGSLSNFATILAGSTRILALLINLFMVYTLIERRKQFS